MSTPSPAEAQALLALIGGALVAVVIAIVVLLRSGRGVGFPDLGSSAGPSNDPRREGRVTRV